MRCLDVEHGSGLGAEPAGQCRADQPTVEQRVGGVAGSPAPNHIKLMPRQQISPEAVDLFSIVQPSPTPRSGPPRRSAHQPTSPAKLTSLSDAELAGLLKNLLGEVQRRTAGRALRQGRPELERAVREAASSLARLQPKQSGLSRRVPPKPAVVHEAKRKSIRAALRAGVKPTQVAKHFGVPLTFVREVASEPR